jgi:hypothetical protein
LRRGVAHIFALSPTSLYTCVCTVVHL